MKEYEKLQKLNLPKRFEDKICHDITYLLSCEKYNDIKKIILFGSCARGTMRLTSDVDLLVITKEEFNRSERGEIASILEEPIDAVHSDVIFYTEEQFIDSKRLITMQIKKEGICLYQKEDEK